MTNYKYFFLFNDSKNIKNQMLSPADSGIPDCGTVSVTDAALRIISGYTNHADGFDGIAILSASGEWDFLAYKISRTVKVEFQKKALRPGAEMFKDAETMK